MRSLSSAPQVEKKHRPQHGFTLLEVMIVLAVISILTLVTVPRYAAVTEHYRLEGSARTVMERLRYAKQLAIEQRQSVYVGLTTGDVRLLSGTSPALQGLDEPKHYATGVAFVPSASTGLLSFTDVNSVSYQGLYYNWQGFVFGAGGSSAELMIALQGRLGQTAEIHMNALMGTPVLTWP